HLATGAGDLMPQLFLYQPLRLGRQGGVAVTDDPNRHLRDKILAVLFTAPGERVNQPDFGVGLNRALFEPLDDLTIAALQFRISQGLDRQLSDEIIFDDLQLISSPDQGELDLRIDYRRRSDRVARTLEVKL
ncbi:MAG TPA: GPW/gp25 family protein, partial [Polyangiaceae bacterium]